MLGQFLLKINMLGVHWGTFVLTDKPQLGPEQDPQGALEDAGVAEARFLARPGDCWTRRSG
jgi:hypothetical protein